MNEGTIAYVGSELELFQHARHWKAYWMSRLTSWVRGDVLEVGPGLGANTLRLQNPAVRTWLCLEPDAKLAAALKLAAAGIPTLEISIGTIEKVKNRSFDCILYIDVLEHIEDDRTELANATRLLRPQGHLIVLAPAHPFLYSPFDASIGHYRRYSARTLKMCGPASCRLEALYFLDSVGMLASACNRILLRQSQPTLQQILFWDRWMVPVSTLLDPLLGRRVGKSILASWVRNEND